MKNLLVLIIILFCAGTFADNKPEKTKLTIKSVKKPPSSQHIRVGKPIVFIGSNWFSQYFVAASEDHAKTLCQKLGLKGGSVEGRTYDCNGSTVNIGSDGSFVMPNGNSKGCVSYITSLHCIPNESDEISICDRGKIGDKIAQELDTNCSQVSSGALSIIDSLDFEKIGLSTLPNEAFKGLNSLRKLYLDGNDLKELPSGLFNNLSKLEVLDLDDNQIEVLPSTIFSGLTSLEELRLNKNHLEALPSTIFGGLTNLEYLSLNSNNIHYIPGKLFSELSSLVTIGLAGNRLKTVAEGTFHNLSSLKTVHLGGNNLDKIPSNIFYNNKHMANLYLANNKITSLPNKAFQNSGLVYLGTLDLRNNNMSAIHSNAFSGLRTAKRVHFTIDLSNNQISLIEDNAFASIHGLRHLNLEKNIIKSISMLRVGFDRHPYNPRVKGVKTTP